MSHQKNFSIKMDNVTEMVAIRAVVKAFGYPLYEGFERATKDESYAAVIYEDGDSVQRTTRSSPDSITLQEFIERQAKTPAQVELEKLEEQVSQLNKQIVSLKATISYT